MVAEKRQAQAQQASHASKHLSVINHSTSQIPHIPFVSSGLPLKKQQNFQMELHDASGTILREYPVNPDANPSVQQTHQQTVQPPIQHAHQSVQHAAQHHQQKIISKQEATIVQHNQHLTAANKQGTGLNGAQSGTNQVVGSTPENVGQLHHQSNVAAAAAAAAKKPARMPGTKQCPTCHNTIAAAVAKCPKCPHVFREKKEKVKRSGKRGKKNCPKCNYENPSACSSCKGCKHVFRLKLIDKYKQMRPSRTNEHAVAEAAAAAHAAANMVHGPGSGGVTAVATVPLQAGVATFSTPMQSQMQSQMHPGHVIPSLGAPPHSGGMYHQQHNVHATGMPQMHPHQMPPTGMHPHQTHHQNL